MANGEQVGAATVTVVVQLASLPEAGHDTCGPRFLLDGPKMLLLDSRDPETPEHRFTFDRVLGPEHAQEAEQEFLENIQAVLGSVSRGYNVSVLIRGREAKELDLVPQLLAMLFEEIQPQGASKGSLLTLSLVQLSSLGRGRDLLLPGPSNLTFLDVYPLGLVVEGASETEIFDSKSGCQLYLKAMEGLDRDCSLLTVTVSCLGPSTLKRPWSRCIWRGSLRVLQLPEAPDCPLLLALAGRTSKAHMGSLPWIVTRLLSGNSYSSLLLHLDPQATPLSLLLASLSGAEGARDPAQVNHVSPILWDASEEIQAKRATIQNLRSGLSGTVLQESQLTQMSLVLRELKVLKNQSRYWETRLLKGARSSAPGLPNQQAHDVALQFMLARTQRQLLREHHRSQIQEKLICLEQDKEIVTEQVFRACRGLWKEQAAAREFHHRILLTGVLQDAISLATQNQQLQVQNKQLQQEDNSCLPEKQRKP
ncbi:uncharacterized protein LOC141506251 isoform X2 [Macrotis lagotis]|uniref:uncharacterized protein LOC141506251 isoform X2 n=1 Tax=Macrotis lagotis TaxID=92651 RepID=UPI003D680696